MLSSGGARLLRLFADAAQLEIFDFAVEEFRFGAVERVAAERDFFGIGRHDWFDVQGSHFFVVDPDRPAFLLFEDAQFVPDVRFDG